jgi:hypothetical protein
MALSWHWQRNHTTTANAKETINLGIFVVDKDEDIFKYLEDEIHNIFLLYHFFCNTR